MSERVTVARSPAAEHEAPPREVSLRELYLVVRRGLPLVLLCALLGGGLAYLQNARRAPVFVAASTVLVTPPPLQLGGLGDGEALSFSPSNEISFRTYETLARSQPVLEEAASSLPGGRVTAEVLASLGSVSELVGPQRADQAAPLSVIHRVRSSDPELAARAADAWAQSTLGAVRASLFASLSPIDAATEAEVARFQAEVEAVEARTRAFEASDGGLVLEARAAAISQQLTEGRAQAGALEGAIAASSARLEALRAQRRELGAAGVGATGDVLALLRAQRAASPVSPVSAPLPPPAFATRAPSLAGSGLSGELETALLTLAERTAQDATESLRRALARQQRAQQAAATEAAERSRRDALALYLVQSQGAPEAGTGAAALLLEADLRAEEVRLSGLRAELAALRAGLGRAAQEAAAVQRQLAAFNQGRGRLERELENALNSYNTVAQLQASISYLTELAPTNARILSHASVPSNPVGPRSTFSTVVGALLGALAGLLLAFLRAAVRAPAPRKVTA